MKRFKRTNHLKDLAIRLTVQQPDSNPWNYRHKEAIKLTLKRKNLK